MLTWTKPDDGTPVRNLRVTRAVQGRAAGTRPAGLSRVRFVIQPHCDIVRLAITHENLGDEAECDTLAAQPCSGGRMGWW